MPRHLRHGLVVGTFLIAACGAAPAVRPKPVPPDPFVPAFPLIPAPASMQTCAGSLRIDGLTTVSGPGAPLLAEWLGLKASAVVPAGGTIELRAAAVATPELAPASDQSFHLEVRPGKAVVTAPTTAGAFYGAQALAQLAGARRIAKAAALPDGGWSAPCVTIDDAPRVGFRAMHLDVSRHFFERPVVERYIDLLAFYRFDVFHWHLTDDQGFRFASNSHPELRSNDGWYSTEDMRAVVAYARARNITVIPEIEMPGHVRALLDKHPELSCTGVHQPTATTWGIFDDVLCAGNPGSLALMKDVLGDVVEIFPSEMIHVGGDEVPPTRWNACPKCQARMKALHTDAVGLEHAFMSDVYALLAVHKRRPAVWDEALPEPGSPASANPPTIFAWQSRERGDLAVSRGFDAVYAPYKEVYFNFKQPGMEKVDPGHEGALGWEAVHGFDLGHGAHARGGEGTIWTEFVRRQVDIDQLVMPRMAALADALWPVQRPSTDDFARRFNAQMSLLDASEVAYYIDVPLGLRPRTVILDETKVTLLQPPLFRAGTIRYTRDGTVPTEQSPRYRDPLQITETMTLQAALFLANGRRSNVARAQFIKETPRPPVTAAKTGVECTYYEGTYHRLDEVGKQQPKSKLTMPTISLDQARAERFALWCTAFIEVPETAVHRFYIHADDGLRVTVDGTTVTEIDEERGPRGADGDIALAAGPHKLDVVYFQGTEGKELTIERAGPDGVKHPLAYVK